MRQNATREAKFAPPTPAMVGKAAGLEALDHWTDEQIARQLGIARRTLARWKRRPEWAAAKVAGDTVFQATVFEPPPAGAWWARRGS
jgi:hypothetical protein